MADFLSNVSVAYSAERVSDLLCSALEGGSNYWYWIAENNREEVGAEFYSDVPVKENGYLVFCDREEVTRQQPAPGTEMFRLDRAAITKGLEVFRTEHPRHFANWVEENDDAETGDVFLQVCLFGKLVYA